MIEICFAIGACSPIASVGQGLTDPAPAAADGALERRALAVALPLGVAAAADGLRRCNERAAGADSVGAASTGAAPPCEGDEDDAALPPPLRDTAPALPWITTKNPFAMSYL